MFRFKQFNIIDTHCGMKIGTDGVLIGAWASCSDARHVIDVGSGCGLIALMIAQRSNARIDAIEADRDACEDALSNITASPWHGRIKLHNLDFLRFKPTHKADLIVSNPPFFNEQLKSPDTSRSLARHEGELNYCSLVDYAALNLSPTGRLSFIYPFGREDEIIYKAEFNHLKLRRICHVAKSSDQQPIRTMFEFCRIDGSIEYDRLDLYEGQDMTHTSYFTSLCRDFYLNL